LSDTQIYIKSIRERKIEGKDFFLI
jgi:hypothetical protein